MANFVKAGVTGDFQDGTKKKVMVEGQEIMLARVGGKYYATYDRCPHMGGDLAAGVLEGMIVTCPRHGSQFDIRDGTVIRWLKGSGFSAAALKVTKPKQPLKTYPVKIDGDAIMIEI